MPEINAMYNHVPVADLIKKSVLIFILIRIIAKTLLDQKKLCLKAKILKIKMFLEITWELISLTIVVIN